MRNRAGGKEGERTEEREFGGDDDGIPARIEWPPLGSHTNFPVSRDQILSPSHTCRKIPFVCQGHANAVLF